MAPRDGFEPPTKRLTAACSTAELPGINNSTISRCDPWRAVARPPSEAGLIAKPPPAFQPEFAAIHNYSVRPRNRHPANGSRWRPGPESNRRTRICSPLHNHSATGPATTAIRPWGGRYRLRAPPGSSALGGYPHVSVTAFRALATCSRICRSPAAGAAACPARSHISARRGHGPRHEAGRPLAAMPSPPGYSGVPGAARANSTPELASSRSGVSKAKRSDKLTSTEAKGHCPQGRGAPINRLSP